MFNYASPESRGVSTASIKKYISHLESAGLSTHSLIIARGNDVLLERYWRPFNRDFLHRMYSVTKSFVAIAIGFLQDEGRISLNDPISVYFPAECAKNPDENIKKQTIRHMLTMTTAVNPSIRGWFTRRPEDRVADYFTPRGASEYESDNLFRYDSTGSFVLGALIERVSGMELMDYLYEKLFKRLGIEQYECLKCPGGHSWSDSALLMRPLDLLKVARFMQNGGSIDGEQILSADYVREATSSLVDTSEYGFETYAEQGYGYLIWRTKRNSFFFNGMGCQFAICSPDKDMIMIYNGDNQGCSIAKSLIIDGYFTMIYDEASDEVLPEYRGEPIPDNFTLFSVRGGKSSELEKTVGNVRYVAEENPIGISEFSLSFGKECIFRYVRNGRELQIPFGMCENVFSYFPEEGYSDEIGSKPKPGNRYRCAASAAWRNGHQLLIRVQIIDKYFGNLGIRFSFRENKAVINMSKVAEDFLFGYDGIINAVREP